MIRDLESEIVALRNLTETTCHALMQVLQVVMRDSIPETMENLKFTLSVLKEQRELYEKHRTERFCQEVADAGRTTGLEVFGPKLIRIAQ